MNESTYKILTIITSVLHFISGAGFLFKIPNLYYPECYIVNGKPGDGSTPFENLCRIPFGLCYVAPFIAVLYALHIGSKEAKKASLIFPIVYHYASTIACYTAFKGALNTNFTSYYAASMSHLFFGVICSLLFYYAEDIHNQNSPVEENLTITEVKHN